jgi:selenide,water dikinase
LDQVLPRLPRLDDANLLVGFDTADDAGVYRLSPECALVQTVDFFTPIVDDPHTFGAIAAANALSDVYAMGGRPLTALSIACYPPAGELDDFEAILRGGAGKMIEAGCVVLGGHSVGDEEIKFGYAVTGLVHPERFWSNAGARPGGQLTLTKPLGTGVVATALKRGAAHPDHVRASIECMLALNRCEARPHACTDITGFGLLGHAREMALASGVTLEIDWRALEFLPGALEYSKAGAHSGGLKNNRAFAAPAVEFASPVPPEIEALLYDPQTSGGLLFAAPPGEACGRVIGAVVERGPAPVRIV